MEPFANLVRAVWDFVASAPIERAALAVALIGVLGWTGARLVEALLDSVTTLARGHAPARRDDEDELVEAVADVHERATAIADSTADTYTVLDRVEDMLLHYLERAERRGEQSVEHLATLIAAQRTTTAAVLALDEDNDALDLDALRAQLYAYATPHGWAVAPGATDEHADGALGTNLHRYAEAAARGHVPDLVVVDDAPVDLTKRDQ